MLENISNVNAMILGSPIYFGSVTGEMRSFIERAAYPYFTSDFQAPPCSPKKIKTGIILTLGEDENRIKESGMDRHFALIEMVMGRIFGSAESLVVTGADLFDDYTKYVCSPDHAAEAKQRWEEKFPIDCQKAFDMGVRLAKK